MSAITDIFSSTLGAAALNAVSLHVIIRAPSGDELWIPVTIPTGINKSDTTSLWPAGFSVGISLQAPPANSDLITLSTPKFLASNSWPLLSGFLFAPSKSSVA